MSNPKNVKIPSKASYKLKYKLLKRCIKEIVLENAALCDRASEIQNQILISQEERKFLWKKYSAIQGNSFISEDILNNTGASSQPSTTEQKKTPRRTPMQKNGNAKPPRQTPSRAKQKRKSAATATGAPVDDVVSSNEITNMV